MIRFSLRNIILFLSGCCLLVLTGCGSPKPGKNKKPDKLLSKDTMVKMLVGIHIAEGKSTVLDVPEDSSKEIYSLMEQQLYNRFGVSPDRFRDSYRYYLRDLEAMEKIYEKVEDSLKAKRDAMNK